MTWFFAFVIVAVLGVIAVVASGRGGAMAETFDDRPDSRVQAEGPLTSDDLRAVRFSTAFRGYRMSEVDALLDRLGAELDAAGREPVAHHNGVTPGEPTVHHDGEPVHHAAAPVRVDDGTLDEPAEGRS
ncbi:DivIVA domain-containing protein [Nocardioides mesophilus]|uniref:DivIVA domain-containing protein n=1 Tax=Nocardioides mesophilus TaxID=433659 RepID=A0A7G9R7Z6_9ACTN|nr:DivIVA domain-containing protein [Nocardioides mesophilus]QNN51721.1 DivIVA domain-containing protein [Nocardioides mesophilus]